MGRGQEVIDVLRISRGRWVGGKCVDIPGRRRQADEVEAEPAGERPRVGRRRRLQPDRSEPLPDEVVDRIHVGRDRRFDRLFVSPVTLIFGPLGDPSFESLFLRRSQLFVRLWRRHNEISVRIKDAGNELAIVDLSRSQNIHCVGPNVEPEPGLSCRLVRPVTGVAVVRQDRPDVAVEPDRLGVRVPGKGENSEPRERESHRVGPRGREQARYGDSITNEPRSWLRGTPSYPPFDLR